MECSVYFPDSTLYIIDINLSLKSKYRKFLHFPTASHNLVFFMSYWLSPSNIFFCFNHYWGSDAQQALSTLAASVVIFTLLIWCLPIIWVQQQLSSLEDVLLPFPLTYTPWHSIESCHLPIGPCLPDNSD